MFLIVFVVYLVNKQHAMTMGPHRTRRIVAEMLLLLIVGQAFAPNRQQRPARAVASLPVATIDAAEVFDGHHFDGTYARTKLDDVRAVSPTTSSTLAWAAIGTLFSLSVALNTQAISAALRSLSVISSWYLTRLEMAPLVTKCITGGIIALLGDYGAQWFEYKRAYATTKPALSSSDSAIALRAGAVSARSRRGRLSINGTYDSRRGMARFVECLLISSPIMHYGYDLFEHLLPVGGGGGNLFYRSFAALSHVFADSVFLDGIFVFTSILATSILEGRSRKHVLPNLRKVYLPTLKASIMTSGLLMPLEFLSFLFLPVQLRVLSVNAVDLVWTAVVSFVSHDGEAKGAHS